MEIDRAESRARWHPDPAPFDFLPPLSLMAGLALIAVSEALMVAWHAGTGGAVAFWTAVFLTPICWTGFLLAADGALHRREGGSPARTRPRRFALAYATSIPVWLFFDGINFALLGAWDYHGLPESLPLRWLGFALSFGAIGPAMFLCADTLLRMRLDRLSGPRVRVPAYGGMLLSVLGAALLLLAIGLADPLGTVPLWLCLLLLLDPLNRRLGAPSLLADWEAGRWGRTVALMAGGFACGLLWEFWNYWAVAKWTYHLPFLGPLEHVRYFEMPVVGLAGFLPFALECWAAFQTIAWAAGRLGLRLEPLPANRLL